ncbi:hypothetical protein [Nocardia sp. XZ_19_369]|uniref:hypothetical protein n=1 Tax=Nocardia sp. XZ_19_369 TaxID=2769487 RepID=UPI00188E0249|nr:hypothetical protein [Nocardia sp. XZ_19_369]
MATITRGFRADRDKTDRYRARPSTSPVYVNLTDKAFLRLHHGYGLPVVTQTLTILGRRPGRDELNSMHALLQAGPLARRVHRSTAPFARARWVPADTALPLAVDPGPIAETDALTWANDQAQYPLAPDAGFGWRLSAVPTTSGGMIVCLTKSHAVADGHAGLMAEAGLVDPELATQDGLAAEVGLWRELADGAHRGITVARQAVTELRRASHDPGHRAALRAALFSRVPEPEPDPRGWREQSVVLTFDAAQWKSAAERDGGTTNTLYCALTADLLRRCPLIDNIPPVLTPAVRILRETDQPDSNSFTRVPIVVQREWLDNHDLTTLRAVSKAAFAAVATVGSGVLSQPRRMPPDLLDVLPDGVVHRLLETVPITVGMCSNMGVLDDFVAPQLAEFAPSLHMKRAVVQGIDVPRTERQPVALATWLSESGGTMHWALESLKPEMAHTAAELADLAKKVARSWGLHPTRIYTGDTNP